MDTGPRIRQSDEYGALVNVFHGWASSGSENFSTGDDEKVDAKCNFRNCSIRTRIPKVLKECLKGGAAVPTAALIKANFIADQSARSNQIKTKAKHNGIPYQAPFERNAYMTLPKTKRTEHQVSSFVYG